MRTVNIRDVRGPLIEELSASGQLAGITNSRVLAAVLVPVGQDWIDHLIEVNWSRLYYTVTEGGVERDTQTPMVTLAESVAGSQAQGNGSASRETGEGLKAKIAEPLGTVRRLASSFLRPASPDTSGAEPPTMRTVRIGDLSGKLLAHAAEAREILAVTNANKLAAFLFPVTEELVMHLIENNLTRVLFNVNAGAAERELEAQFTTLDDALRPQSSPSRAHAPVAGPRAAQGARAEGLAL